jgi:cobalt-zinc-cadmium efflux system protein
MHVHRVAPGQHRPRQRAALLLCIVLTTAMMVVEVLGSYWTGSLMLLSDAAHMLSHSLALFVSYFALRLASARMGPRSHFGFYRAEVLGAFVNGIGVLLFTAWIVWEAVERIYAPVEIRGAEMTAIAVLGLLVNLATAWILHRAGTEDLNTRSAFVHMLGDTVSSVAIVAGGGLLWLTGWQPVDVLLSLGVAAVVLLWGVRLLRESAGVLMEMSPPGVDLAELRSAVVDGVPVVQDLHDVHFWEITSGYRCLTAHVVVRETTLQGAAAAREQVSELLRSRYGVRHATLQMEEA